MLSSIGRCRSGKSTSLFSGSPVNSLKTSSFARTMASPRSVSYSLFIFSTTTFTLLLTFLSHSQALRLLDVSGLWDY